MTPDDMLNCFKCGGDGCYCWYGPQEFGAVECADCDNIGPGKDTWIEAVNAWNTEQVRFAAGAEKPVS